MPTLHKSTQYTLNHLIADIRQGNIALPDIQRPFVWKPSKVRALVDSMYRGYPVGTLMFWEVGTEIAARQIGDDNKKAAARLIVDGQQRLTSLYSVITGNYITTKTFKKQRIQIAFRPVDEMFQVANAASGRNPEFIPDITVLWEQSYKTTLRGFFARLNKYRPKGLSDEEEERLEERIDRVRDLRHFPFHVIELGPNADESHVAEIFVRINYEGVKLNQSDFILTLMSVYWEQGRSELERFCREAINPSVSGLSPKNSFLDPSPDQLLRAGVGLGFRRGKLQHVYSILRGKELKTGIVSAEQRSKQFYTLKRSLDEVLDLNNWHEYLQCLVAAGFINRRMVTSNNTVIFAYILWLIGRHDFGVSHLELQRVIGRWFFMSQTTGRYTSSTETQLESDLGIISDIATSNGSAFCEELDRIVDTNLTHDYWEITLPNQLDASASRSPALFAYWAALNLLDVKVLFGNKLIKDLLEQSEGAIERHHLFPKKFLDSIGVKSTKQVNAIANMAFVEWPQNTDIITDSPAEYWPELSRGMHSREIQEQMRLHSLPDNWHQMHYTSFLTKRRQLIAATVRLGFEQLSSRPADRPAHSYATVT